MQRTRGSFVAAGSLLAFPLLTTTVLALIHAWVERQHSVSALEVDRRAILLVFLAPALSLGLCILARRRVISLLLYPLGSLIVTLMVVFIYGITQQGS
jgi:hypothetical protein